MNFVNSLHKLFSFDINNPISFNGGMFLLFFTIFIIIYSAIYKNKTARTLFVIAFSLFFYYKLTGWFLLALLFTLSCDYILAILIYKSESKGKRLLYFIVSLCLSLGLLIYFKYTNFFIQSINSLSGKQFSTLSIIVPLGISFYTFRTVSYIIDVYREDIKPSFNFLDYVFYMTFFPLLIAGPITRAKLFLPTLQKRFRVNDYNVSKSMILIIQGLIKKAIIADYIAQYCNLVFDAPGMYSGFENLIAVYGFALQIYFDFSGYTDMAIGISKLMGFDIGINFNKPYHALNVTDFWRRWHISLSSWLRDYLFTPLSIKFRNWGKAGIIFSLLLTFILCGFWHGANLTYIFWGGLFGLAMAFEILTGKIRKNIRKKINVRVYNFISWFLTFNFVTFLWIFFRAQNMTSAWLIIKQIFTQMDWAYFGPFVNVRGMLVIIMLIGIAAYVIPDKWFHKISQQFTNLPFWAKAIIFIGVVQMVVQFQSADVQPFLYAQY
jgi:alginate O-acetyltransferase complex protein AlgI